MVELWHVDAIGSPSFQFKLRHVRGAMTAVFSLDSQFISIGISDSPFEMKGLKTLYVLQVTQKGLTEVYSEARYSVVGLSWHLEGCIAVTGEGHFVDFADPRPAVIERLRLLSPVVTMSAS